MIASAAVLVGMMVEQRSRADRQQIAGGHQHRDPAVLHSHAHSRSDQSIPPIRIILSIGAAVVKSASCQGLRTDRAAPRPAKRPARANAARGRSGGDRRRPVDRCSAADPWSDCQHPHAAAAFIGARPV